MDPEPEPELNTVAILFIIIVILIAMSAFFSATETAFSSVNTAKLKVKAADGSKRAKLALHLADEKYDQLLYTVLIGNNIVNLTMATLSTLMFAQLITSSESLSATVSTIVSTIAVLIFGETTPKTIAKERPEAVSMAFCHIIYFLMIVFKPLTLAFSGLKRLIRKTFKLKDVDDGLTEEELLTIVEEANEDGTLDKNETELISSAIEFNDAEVGDILVPRVDVVAVSQEMSMEEIKSVFILNAYSRMPVYNKSIDQIVGMLHEKDFFKAYVSGETSINGIVKPIAIASEHMKISTLLSQMKAKKIHMAVVLDEYGGTLGIATMEDVLEELVGDIWDEHDEVVDYFTKKDDNHYIVDGRADLDDFFELFSIEDREDKFDAQTVSGWVIENLGIIPRPGLSFDYENIHVTVTRSNNRKVHEVEVEIKEKTDEKED